MRGFPMRLMTICLCLVLAAGAARAAEKNTLPADTPTEVGGFELACSGVGDEARNDPRWADFPVRIEFANRDAQYLSDVLVTVSDEKGGELFQVSCETPWLLAKLPAGKYKLSGMFEGITKTASFSSPASGQKRVVVTFPEIAGDQ